MHTYIHSSSSRNSSSRSSMFIGYNISYKIIRIQVEIGNYNIEIPLC